MGTKYYNYGEMNCEQGTRDKMIEFSNRYVEAGFNSGLVAGVLIGGVSGVVIGVLIALSL